MGVLLLVGLRRSESGRGLSNDERNEPICLPFCLKCYIFTYSRQYGLTEEIKVDIPNWLSRVEGISSRLKQLTNYLVKLGVLTQNSGALYLMHG